MPEIRPITDLRNTTEISNLCHAVDKPIFITKNGYGDLAIMSIKTYEKQLALSEIYSKLFEAEKQIEENNLLDGEEALETLRKKYEK